MRRGTEYGLCLYSVPAREERLMDSDTIQTIALCITVVIIAAIGLEGCNRVKEAHQKNTRILIEAGYVQCHSHGYKRWTLPGLCDK